MSTKKEFDVIVWGASGFTGKLVCEYIFKKFRTNNELKWAMAGRDLSKLELVRAEIADHTVPIVIAESNDIKSLDLMTQRTKVVCTTVGPYDKYGSKLVQSCIENRTHYCDLAGEVQWIRKMIDKYHEKAKRNTVNIFSSFIQLLF